MKCHRACFENILWLLAAQWCTVIAYWRSKVLGLILIRHWLNTSASDWYLSDKSLHGDMIENANIFHFYHNKPNTTRINSGFFQYYPKVLTHWGRVTHICVSKLAIIGSDNGLSPGQRQAITWTNVGILLIRPLGTNFSEILIKILTFSFKKMHLKVSSAKRRPFCLGLNVLKSWSL